MQKTDGEYRPFYHTFLTKERDIQKSACAAPWQKVNPRLSRWVPHLDASNFPKIRPCLSPRITAPVLILWIPHNRQTPNTADCIVIIRYLRGTCQRNERVFMRLVFLRRGRFPLRSSSRSVCQVLPLPSDELPPPQTPMQAKSTFLHSCLVSMRRRMPRRKRRLHRRKSLPRFHVCACIFPPVRLYNKRRRRFHR